MSDKKEKMKVDRGAHDTEIIQMDFPSNSHKRKEETKNQKKVEKVTTGKVVKQRRHLVKIY